MDRTNRLTEDERAERIQRMIESWAHEGEEWDREHGGPEIRALEAELRMRGSRRRYRKAVDGLLDVVATIARDARLHQQPMAYGDQLGRYHEVESKRVADWYGRAEARLRRILATIDAGGRS